jgi:hypothetical protein
MWIVQVGKPVGVNGRSVKHILLATTDREGPIVLWTKDTATYDSVVKELRSAAIASPLNLMITPREPPQARR